MKIISALFLSLVFTCAAFSQQSLKTGAQAPDFAASSIDGKALSLGQMQGKVVVLTFWSTRCQICHSEIPKLNRMAASYSGKDVVFLAVTMENSARVEPYLKKNPFNFTIVPDGFGMVLQYADKDRQGNLDMGFPAYYLIDQNGRVAMRGSGWDKTGMITSEIGRLLNSGD
jgi:peroxiredoxin